MLLLLLILIGLVLDGGRLRGVSLPHFRPLLADAGFAVSGIRKLASHSVPRIKFTVVEVAHLG